MRRSNPETVPKPGDAGAGATELLWFARADNLGDVLAYSATSVLTQTAPGRAPLPGRSLKVGVQVAF